jgi:Co/Zn/Cd efflux system component
MAHYRRPLAAAAALNTAIFVVEAIAGFQADSLSLVMDSVHISPTSWRWFFSIWHSSCRTGFQGTSCARQTSSTRSG